MHLALCSEVFQYLLTTWKAQSIFIVYSILSDKLGEGTGVARTTFLCIDLEGEPGMRAKHSMYWQPESHMGKRMSAYPW